MTRKVKGPKNPGESVIDQALMTKGKKKELEYVGNVINQMHKRSIVFVHGSLSSKVFKVMSTSHKCNTTNLML